MLGEKEWNQPPPKLRLIESGSWNPRSPLGMKALMRRSVQRKKTLSLVEKWWSTRPWKAFELLSCSRDSRKLSITFPGTLGWTM